MGEASLSKPSSFVQVHRRGQQHRVHVHRIVSTPRYGL
jgi:hypothetical protein